jgi:hypothetical protein
VSCILIAEIRKEGFNMKTLFAVLFISLFIVTGCAVYPAYYPNPYREPISQSRPAYHYSAPLIYAPAPEYWWPMFTPWLYYGLGWHGGGFHGDGGHHR